MSNKDIHLKEKTYKYTIPNEEQDHAKELSMYSGRIYSKAVSLYWKIYEQKSIGLSNKSIEKYMDQCYRQKKDFPLHSQSQQAAYQQFMTARDSFFKNHKKLKKQGKSQKLKELNPPYKTKKYNKVCYKKQAFSFKEDDKGTYLRISNGRKGKALKLYKYNLDKLPQYGELIFNHNKRKYELHLTVKVEMDKYNHRDNNTLAIDLGVIHPMVCYEDKNNKSIIFNGGELNSKLQYRNKKLTEFQEKMSRCKKYSNRYRKLKHAKDRVLGNLKNQIEDILHKQLSYLISYCLQNEISTIVVGDVDGIRENVNFHQKVGQKIHQWVYGKIYNMLEQKCDYVNINLVKQEESYTSQSCPNCGHKYKPNDRNYNCSNCSYSFHRDSIGSINIYRKFLGEDLSKGTEIIPLDKINRPKGVRYKPNMKIPLNWNNNPFKESA